MPRSALVRLLAMTLCSAIFISCAASTSAPSANPPSPTDSAGGPGGEPSALKDQVEQTLWPVVPSTGSGVAVELAEPGKSVRLGPAGGSVEVSAADGTRYVLTIPANALTFDTEIRLTPVASVTGYSVDADAMYAVDVAPHDLMLWDAATLEVVPPSGSDISTAVALAYDGGGANLHRTPLGRDPSKLQIVLAHFSGGLVYVGDGIYLPAPPPPEPQSFNDLQKSVAETIDRERSGEATSEETSAALESLLDEYMRDSLIPKTSQMRADCEYAKHHVWEYVAFVRQVQLLGMSHVIERHSDDLNGSTLLGDVIEKCWEDETGDCVRYDATQIRELIGLV